MSPEIANALAWPPLLPLAQAARYASCSRWTLSKAVRDGKLRIAGRRGRSPVFSRDDLDRWLLGAPLGPVQPEAMP